MDLSTLTQPDTLKALGLTLAAAAKFLGTATAEKVVQDAYDRVKKRLLTAFGKADDIENALQQIERKPDSQHPPAMLAEELEPTTAAQDSELLQLAQTLAKLLEQRGQLPPTFTITQQGSGSLAMGQGNVVASAGGAAIGGDLKGDLRINSPSIVVADVETARSMLRQSQPPPDLQRALQSYLTFLCDRFRYLEFKGMGVSDRVPLRFELLDLYVPLKARIEMPLGDTWVREFQVAGRDLPDGDRGSVGERLSRPVPLQDLLAKHSGLVILGDPGAGKTTFLKHLTLLLATGQQAEKRLPVLLPLSAYANAIATHDVPLDEFLAAYFHGLGVDLPVDGLLRQALRAGQAVVMLDGLDEVQEAGLRETVVRRVVDFYNFHRRAGNKFLLTSRIIGYREVRPTAEGLEECTIDDFDDAEITTFVSQWTAAVEKAARGETVVAAQDAARERKELLAAVKANPGVRRLAANPLLLTILALMKRQGVTLPERRVELYQKYVETFLSTWNRARGLDRPPTRDLDVVETLKVLAPLALWMHQINPGAGLVKKDALLQEVERLFREQGDKEPEKAARRFIEDVRVHAGLLLERGPGQYGFIHLTFEEYLAAVAQARKGQVTIEPILDALLERVGSAPWREVALLTVGYLGIVQQRDQAASELVQGLIGAAERTQEQSVILAGEAVADVWPSGVSKECRDQTRAALLRTLTTAEQVPAVTRARAGQVLAQLGDPRLGVVPATADDLGETEFCYVPPGPFRMGDENRPNDTLNQGYWISRLPVTVAQFRRFAEARADPFKPDWAEAIAQRGTPFNMDNHPVVLVTWPEALAFCQWMTGRWRDRLPAAYSILLPSEAEWEKAARGGPQLPKTTLVRSLRNGLTLPTEVTSERNPEPDRRYPWLGDFDANKVNASETGIGTTSAVGCFQSGRSPYAVEELSGNVWEWTRSSEGRDDLNTSSTGARVLRGGAFGNDSHGVRCAGRYRYDPVSRFRSIGFRVVASPFVSGP